jgi:hypothetical protein
MMIDILPRDDNKEKIINQPLKNHPYENPQRIVFNNILIELPANTPDHTGYHSSL